MSADDSPEFAGFTSGGSANVEHPDDVRPADADNEESTTPEESADPDHPYDSMAESGTENAPEDEVGSREDEEGLLAPGSTAEGAGTSLGAVPTEARREAEPLGEHDGEAGSGQLADERWRSNGVDPLG